MNSKMIAVTMAVIMACVGLTVVAADGSDAVDTERVAVDSELKKTIAVNEGNYTHSDNYTLTFEIYLGEYKSTTPTGAVTYTVEKSTTESNKTWYVTESAISEKTSDDAKFSLEIVRDSTDIGKYDITIAGLKYTTTDITFTIVASITITIGQQSTTITDFANYTRTIEVYTAGSSNEIEVSIEDADAAKVGTYFDGRVTTSNIIVADYDWYAVGLDNGLTMSHDGYVSGIPTADGECKFSVYATDSDGNVYYDSEVIITVAPADVATVDGFTYAVYDDGYQTGSYIIEAGSTVVLKLNSTGTGTPEIKTGAIVKVFNTSASATGVNYTDQYGGYKLPSDGSGAYMVQITYNNETVSFMIYIIGEATDITANIVIEGA